MLALLLALTGGCAGSPATPPIPAGGRIGDEIVVCGRLVPTGSRVVLWYDPGGYDAYREDPFFPGELRGSEPLIGRRYGPRRGLRGGDIESLGGTVDQFVVHYDVAGTSRQCFKILHDRRRLSVHFLLDVDGTIYQTLDLRDRGWHATKANDRSVGVEIAHIGAYGRRDHRMLHEWYGHDEEGPFVRFPAWLETGLPSGFVGRPARRDIVRGTVQGQELWQYDFTDAQYEALAKLLAALATVLPRIRLDAPRDDAGAVRPAVLSDADFAAYEGVLGHYHVQANKTDPGPAFDWERVLARARELGVGVATGSEGARRGGE